MLGSTGNCLLLTLHHLVAWLFGNVILLQRVVLKVIQFPLGPIVVFPKRLEPVQLLTFPSLGQDVLKRKWLDLLKNIKPLINLP